ncbi:Fe-S-cluster-containing dehydrogenase component [Desulfohalotomaculum tongense]|uniref:4Fe-4S dicluster domain-containing protein n=1 Tax=Desulforadius tongensis TaxID=1216062 RepID=UPI00195A3B57|nr:4Fe-4S dicluster domain-containing protein [Desulforadius tongensis]MBM7854853.1 Fe-S-cluster-containing dehydrogenase component [Desulforadius tongensis]
MTKCIGCYSCMLACARTIRRSLSPTKAAIQIRTAGGLQSKFVADICRGCIDAPCAAACRCGALIAREGGGVRFIPHKCIGCKDCVEACIIGVLEFDEDSNKPLVCVQCGTCARFCPHQVLTLEERPI